MGRVSALMGTDEFANMVYTDLSGPVFCDDPTYVPAEANAECKGKKIKLLKIPFIYLSYLFVFLNLRINGSYWS